MHYELRFAHGLEVLYRLRRMLTSVIKTPFSVSAMCAVTTMPPISSKSAKYDKRRTCHANSVRFVASNELWMWSTSSQTVAYNDGGLLHEGDVEGDNKKIEEGCHALHSRSGLERAKSLHFSGSPRGVPWHIAPHLPKFRRGGAETSRTCHCHNRCTCKATWKSRTTNGRTMRLRKRGLPCPLNVFY